MTIQEHLGSAVGWLAAPLFSAAGRLRRARVLHPDGVVWTARVEPLSPSVLPDSMGERLAGPALVRFSTALWRGGREWPDALGCAIRFRRSATPSVEPEPDDQDLLLATIRTPLATPLGPVGTHVHDFLANRYFGTAPFDVPGVGRAKWRLSPEPRPADPAAPRSRTAKLVDAVVRGDASMLLELRRTWHRDYVPIARVVLVAAAELDQQALRFSPFRTGRGIVPRGFVHALRRGPYAASQRAGVASRPT